MKQLLPSFPSRARVPFCSSCGRGPGKVSRSPKSSDREVIDIDVDIEYEGHIIICWDCAVEIGALVGMIEQKQADTLKTEIADVTEELAEVKYDLSIAKEALDALRVYNSRNDLD